MFNDSETTANVSDILQKCYDDAFTELPAYNFVSPERAGTLFPVAMPGKACHCLSCGRTFETAYTSGGAVYADKDCLDGQRTLYKKYHLTFPRLEKDEPLVYLQEGYCAACAGKLADSGATGQLVYSLATRLVAAGAQLLPSLLPLIKNSIQTTDWETLLQIAEKNAAAQKVLSDYTAVSSMLVQKITALLDRAEGGTLTAYTGRPLAMIDAMCASLFNEYTIAVPAEGTPACLFYVKSVVKKEKVRRFLSVPRITTIAEALAQPGVREQLPT